MKNVTNGVAPVDNVYRPIGTRRFSVPTNTYAVYASSPWTSDRARWGVPRRLSVVVLTSYDRERGPPKHNIIVIYYLLSQKTVKSTSERYGASVVVAHLCWVLEYFGRILVAI